MFCRSFDNLEIPNLQKTSTFWIHLMFYSKFAVTNLRVVESWSPWRHIRDISQKWRGPDPPPRLSAKVRNWPNPTPPLVRRIRNWPNPSSSPPPCQSFAYENNLHIWKEEKLRKIQIIDEKNCENLSYLEKGSPPKNGKLSTFCW